MRYVLAALFASLLVAVVVAARDADSQKERLEFEVSSVRHNTSRDKSSSRQWQPRRFVATNIPLQALVEMAFDVPENLTRHLIVGGVSNPLANCIQNCSSRDEILSARFDVQATLPQDVHRSQYGAILQQWLQERFKLNAHLENRELPAYALIVAREGRLGPQLRRSKQDCASWYELKKTEPSASEPTDAQGRRLCSQGPLGSINELRLVWRGAGELSSLVNNIRGDLDRPIVDRTGLKGYFEWELTYEVPGLREASPNAMAKVPSLEVALAEQLGLRVVSTTAPFEVLIIESVAMPTPN